MDGMMGGEMGVGEYGPESCDRETFGHPIACCV